MAHDASATWSGFNYQGKVAIFHTLHFINEKLDIDSEFDFNGYTLTLERHEDFEIGNNLGPISFHQVKAYKDPDFSKYRNALLELALELSNKHGVYGYLHTWQPITVPDGKSLAEAVREDIESEINAFNDSADINNTAIGKSLSGNTNLPKRAAILRNAFAGVNGVNHQAIIRSLRDICRQDTGSVNRIQSYQYPDGNFACALEAVEEKIKDELQKYFSKKAVINTHKQRDNAYHFFLGILDRHIVDRHQNVNQGSPLQIDFVCITSIAEMDFEDVSEKYVSYHFKDLFVNQLERFCSEPDLCPDVQHSNCVDGFGCNLRDITNILFELPSEVIWEYYKSFVPHKDLCNEKNILNALNCDIDSVLFTLFKIFFELDSNKIFHRFNAKHINYRSLTDALNLYLPTAIGQAYPSTLAKDIFNNQAMVEILFEVKTIVIGEGLQRIDNIQEALSLNRRSGPLQEPELDENQKEKINDIIKDLRVIPLNVAKDEVNVN